MKFIKSSLMLFMALLYVPSSLFCAAPAQQSKYISATVSICADRFVSLEKAFVSVQPELANAGLQTNPIQQRDYHMTLVGFNLAVNPGLSQAAQDKFKKDIENALAKAAHDGLKKSLDHLKKVTGKAHDPIVLEFSHIGIFQKQVVAIFEMSQVVQILVNTIENYFKNNIQNLLNNGTITSMGKHQEILQPHVSLAKITNAHSRFGAGLTPATSVADFHIGKPVSIISVRLKDGGMPAIQKPINKPAAAQIAPAMQPGMGAARASAAWAPAIQAAKPKAQKEEEQSILPQVPGGPIGILTQGLNDVINFKSIEHLKFKDYSKLTLDEKRTVRELISDKNYQILKQALYQKLQQSEFSAQDLQEVTEQYVIEALQHGHTPNVAEMLNSIQQLKPCSAQQRAVFYNQKNKSHHRDDKLNAVGKIMCVNSFEFD